MSRSRKDGRHGGAHDRFRRNIRSLAANKDLNIWGRGLKAGVGGLGCRCCSLDRSAMRSARRSARAAWRTRLNAGDYDGW